MAWSELPQDLLHAISQKLLDLSDFIRFRVVCKTWRSLSSLADAPPQLPWAVPYSTSENCGIQFYSLSSRRIYTFGLKEVEGKRNLGSSGDYVLTFDQNNGSLSLLNPFTKSEKLLPRTDSDWQRPLYIGPYPIRDEENVVICWKSSLLRTIGSCKPNRDNEWKIIQINPLSYGHAYHKGMYYVNEHETMATRVINLSTGTTVSVIPPPVCTSTGNPHRFDYLISSSDELLGVYRLYRSRYSKEKKFQVYKLDNSKETPQQKWVEMDGIENRILFLDDETGLSVNASEYPGFEGNWIYFPTYDFSEAKGCSTYLICRYNMENGITEEIKDGNWGGQFTWFLPTLN